MKDPKVVETSVIKETSHLKDLDQDVSKLEKSLNYDENLKSNLRNVSLDLIKLSQNHFVSKPFLSKPLCVKTTFVKTIHLFMLNMV